MKTTTTAALSTLLTLASAHGYFQSPIARHPGDTYKSTCGEQAYNNLNSDINNNIQGLSQLASTQSDYNAAECNLWMCKGLPYADNTANVHEYTPGQEIDMYFQIVAPHDGYANVSVVDTASNSVISANLTSWEKYALTIEPMRAEWQNFTVKMPEDLGGKCAEGGACVIQMHWNAPEAKQTYQSCIDFKMAGSSAKRSHARDLRV
ncbi:hypothetical protein PRZ48_013038 [Zasmidium cellare]|uniref:Chitin-binding type-4 domain-containing protein n=1 Tax=Zasmidium cellare TaxID=395010 RepID=A0ABR0E2Y4_ZASCE|nr:hypothetical protein PRZ48_013038 [Zasmidium cellare]